MKTKFFISLLCAFILTGCQGNPSSTSVDSSTDTTEDISTDLISDTTGDISTSDDTREVYEYAIDFSAARSDGFNYNNGDNQKFFLTDYFREDNADVVSAATTVNTYCDVGYVKLGSASSSGEVTITIDSKYEVKAVSVKAKGYSKYFSYGSGESFVEGWSNDDSTLNIDGENYAMPYVEGGSQEAIDCDHDYNPVTNAIHLKSTGDVPNRILLISMEISYVLK